MSSLLTWYNEPAHWSGDAHTLTMTVAPDTDFWRKTHYGFIRDNGPFYYQEQEGDFEARVKVQGAYHELFHQAGLMVRRDPQNWVKTGIEYVEGTQHISAVVTRDVSDWSVVPRQDNPVALWLLLVRKDDYVEIKYSVNDSDFQLLRLAYFPPAEKVQIGMVAAAPGKKSFSVVFSNFQVRPLRG